jgi:predicted acetyltransferase
MPLDIRTATVDEFKPAVDVVSTAFLDRPDLERLLAGVRDGWEPRRTWVAVDGETICGVWRSWPTELTVPGGASLPSAAVGPVTVLPTHRRRGAFAGMTAAAHAGLRELGEVASLLYASEWGIYGHVGYGPATRRTDWTIRTIPARGVHGVPVGTVELVPPVEARDVLIGIFETWRARQAGEIRRRDLTWDLDLGAKEVPWSGDRWKGWVVVHRRRDGTPDGYARYTAKSEEDGQLPAGVVSVEELVALDPAVHADLLRYLLSIDLVRKVVLKARPETDRSRWMLGDLRACTASASWDAVWVRLLDTPRALAARTYEREGRVVLEVVDPEVAGGRECLLLDATPDGTRCTRTDEDPDLTLPVAALGAAYLGGTRLRDVTIATGVDEHRAGALDLADALLHTVDEPGCSTFF